MHSIDISPQIQLQVILSCLPLPQELVIEATLGYLITHVLKSFLNRAWPCDVRGKIARSITQRIMQSQMIACVLDRGTRRRGVVIRRDKEEPRILINGSSVVQSYLKCTYHGEGREAASRRAFKSPD